MLFTSREYLIFLVAVLALYWAIPWHKARVWLLLAASLAFYSAWSHWLAVLVCASASLDWLLALAIQRAGTPTRKRLLLGVSLAGNLGLLSYFKYVNFFLASLEVVARHCGAETSMPVLQVLVPIGLSFYTFEAISYVIDVYRGRLSAERRLSHFLLFILFFPHLVAGPIVRGRDFLPQIERPKRFDGFRALFGVVLILLGLVKKWVVADRMALFADPIFADPLAYRTGPCWMGIIAYALQVYGDFSGYSDMAIGSAHLFGFKLTVNFRTPYLSPNIGEFWRRWHVSLSSWLRDYLFYPLGGSRGSWWQTSRNLLVVMALCGLWHGAAWNFVLFGLLQGVMLIAHRDFARWCRGSWLAALLEARPGLAVRVAVTFVCFSLSMVVFRAPTLDVMGALYQRLFVPGPGMAEPVPAVGFVLTLVLVLLLDLIQLLNWPRLVSRAPALVLGTVCAAVLCLALLFAPGASPPFIYFQF